VTRLLGFSVPEADIEKALTALGMDVVKQGAGQWQVTGPSWRFDMAIEEDLIEEIARIYGYDRLPIRLPAISGGHAQLEEAHLNSRKLADTPNDRGYREVITHPVADHTTPAAVAPKLDA